jgi:hypothetical protein
VFAVVTGFYAAARAVHEPWWPTDFDQLWHAADALIDGRDPYSVVGPGRAFQWDWPLYYPLPAVVYSVPFAWLPLVAARVAFSTVAAGVLGWAIGARARILWPLLLSAAWIISTSRTQWAPLLLAAAWMPGLGFLLMAKPNIGVASLAALNRRGRRIAAIGCAVALVLSLAVRPDWFASWRDATSVSPHILTPVLLPGGFLLALALTRWRRPEARLFLALAVTPHTPSVYDLLLLFFACRTLRESIALALLTQGLYWGIVLFGSFDTFDAYAMGLGRAALLVVYFPVLVAILLRPNESPVPADPHVSSSSPGWRAYMPDSRLDAILLAILIVMATMLVWLPLATYR